MEEAKTLKSLFEAWDRLSERGRGNLLAYGHGLADMEALILADKAKQEKDTADKKGERTA